MTVRLGLFDIMQVDPTDPAEPAGVFQRRLAHLTLADQLGLDCAFVAERHFMPSYRCPSPTAWIGAATQRTTTMRLGVLSYTLPIHHPVPLAEDVAILDQLSDGRLDVGLGLGHRVEELQALAVNPVQRIAIFQERLAILKALWSGGQVSIDGAYTTLNGVQISPLPVQTPHPPLWYTGTNPQAAEWAATQGMNLAIGFRPTNDLRPAAAAFSAAHRQISAEADEEAPGGRIALMRHVYLAETDEQAHAEMRDDLIRLAEMRDTHQGNTTHSHADRRAEAENGLEALLREDIFIAGSPETVTNAIAYAKTSLGIDLLLANLYATGIDDQRVERAMRLLAGEVTDRLRTATASATS